MHAEGAAALGMLYVGGFTDALPLLYLCFASREAAALGMLYLASALLMLSAFCHALRMRCAQAVRAGTRCRGCRLYAAGVAGS